MKCLLFIVLFVYMVVEDATQACNDQGVFGNPDDNSCQTYIFCFRLPDGVFIEKLYACPNGTLFNPLTKVCKKNYHCIPPTLPTTSTTITRMPGVAECTAQGKFPKEDDITCTRYTFCYYLPTGKYIKMNYTCPIGTKFDPLLQTCTAKFKCDETLTTVATAFTSITPKSFSCRKQGRFPVDKDGTCRSYYYCLYLPHGGYTQQIFVCPQGLKFDPRTQSCSQNYQCLSTTESSSLATTETTSIASSTSSIPSSHNFNCSSIGRFPDETDTSCKTYFLCIQLPNGDLGFETFKCPMNENFDPNLQICSESYECSLESSTTLNNTATTLVSSNNPRTTSSIPTSSYSPTTSFTTTTASNDNFTCQTIGRFTDTSDKSCKRYFLCIQLPEGGLGSQIFECSNNENFDPILQLCSESYECSQGESSTVQTESTTYSILTTSLVEKTSDTSLYIPSIISEVTTLTSSNDPKTTSSIPTSSYSPTTSFTTTTASNDNFTCHTIGRFTDTSDKSCKRYFLCIQLPEGDLGSQIFECSKDENFDPILQLCSESYECSQEESLTVQTESTTYSILTTSLVEKTSDTSSYIPSIISEVTTLTSSNDPKTTSSIPTSSYSPKTSFTTTTASNDNFTCHTIGRFTDTSDKSCKRYFLCIQLPEGGLGSQIFKCSKDENFDPILQLCSESYECSQGESSTVQTESTTYAILTTSLVEKTSDTSSYIPSIISEVTTLTSSNDPKTTSSIPTSSYSPTTSFTTTTASNDNFTCHTIGRFTDTSDKSCKRYFLCIQLPEGDLGSQIFECSKDENFDPILQLCSESYECSQEESSTAQTESTTYSILTTSLVEKTSDTSLYIPSIISEVTTLTSSNDPKTTSSIPTSSYSPTTSFTTTTASNDNFTCQTIGRFTDTSDKSCKRYFLCIQLPEGGLGSQIFECSNNENFDPILRLCSESYECSQGESSTVQTESTTYSILTTSLVEKTSDTTITIPTMISSVTTTAFIEEDTRVVTDQTADGSSSTFGFITTGPMEHVCESVGRLPDLKDESCGSYFLCVIGPDGNFLSFKYMCGFNQLFDPNLNKCSSSYTCHSESGSVSVGSPDVSSNMSDP